MGGLGKGARFTGPWSIVTSSLYCVIMNHFLEEKALFARGRSVANLRFLDSQVAKKTEDWAKEKLRLERELATLKTEYEKLSEVNTESREEYDRIQKALQSDQQRRREKENAVCAPQGVA